MPIPPSTNPETNDGDPPTSANPGFALGQLARALTTSQSHADAEVRARAEQRIATWARVFQGMLSGALQIGSRTPVAGIPPWATLQVAQGGFATGGLLAGGDLLPHERELLRSLPAVPAGTERTAITRFYLSDAGLDALRAFLEAGRYRIQVPEEGALLAVAWLLDHGYADQARALLTALGPFADRLRFYPAPAEQAPRASTVVHRQSVGATIGDLQAVRVPREIAAERESVTVWVPLYDQVVTLFAETVIGPTPTLRRESEEKRAERAVVEGGWPCQHYPPGWQEQAQRVLDDYQRLRIVHRLCRAPDRPSENFPILRDILKQCIETPGQLTGREVGRVRAILAAVAAKRGLPGSFRSNSVRTVQQTQAMRPVAAEFAPVLIERLAHLPQDEGLTTSEVALAPVAPDEAERHRLAPGSPLPPKLHAPLRRCLEAPIEALVEQRVILSGDELARTVPQLVAQVRAAGFEDARLRRLYGDLYAAFRRRRSLLLLDLAHQVRFEELPWVAALNTLRAEGPGTRAAAREMIEQLATLTIGAFPERIVPNKLLQELRALAEAAALPIPLVDELAADIFMGDFTEIFLHAAHQAGALLEGTLYERYYGIRYAAIRQIDDVVPSKYGAPTSPAFTQLCFARAGFTREMWHGAVARSGMVIEQAQILTTHNLAVLFESLDLRESLGPRLEELARRCFAWVCRRQQDQIAQWQPRLRVVKNSAYAWRQMVFFLALLPPAAVEEFLVWANGHLANQRPAFQERFGPALRGLTLAAAGQTLDSRRAEATNARRLTGWAEGRHWLLNDP
jgi:hypothetical protein